MWGCWSFVPVVKDEAICYSRQIIDVEAEYTCTRCGMVNNEGKRLVSPNTGYYFFPSSFSSDMTVTTQPDGTLLFGPNHLRRILAPSNVAEAAVPAIAFNRLNISQQ